MSLDVLIVDDSRIARRVALRTLQMAQLPVGKVFQAENGKEALDHLAASHVDLILLDLNMPVMGGLETLERIRADARLCRVPVVVVSSEGNEGRIAGIKQQHACFLRKPFKTEDLVDAVVGALGGVA